jgi:hypothetical protein
MSKRPTSVDDRLFNREPFRHYRRTYSHAEVRWGLAVLVVLATVGVWIGWRGQNPDPTLFASSDPSAAMELPGADKTTAASRGPLPEGLAPDGWTEGEVSSFDAQNLYVKINGRADYFLSYGFEQLTFLTLRAGDADDAPVIDIECYDLRTAANALGAFAGERKDGAPESSGGGLAHLSSNALFVARDRYYIRAIGSDDSAAIKSALGELRETLEAAIGGGDRPWAYELLEGGLQIPVDSIRYTAENAFSFEFAGDFYSALAEGDLQLFVSVRAEEAAAAELAGELREGFASLGKKKGEWIVDKFLGTVSTAAAEGRFVIGVRGAPDRAAGDAWLSRLRAALLALPDSVRDSARPAAPAAPAAGPEDLGEPTYDDESRPEPVREADQGRSESRPKVWESGGAPSE